MNRHTTIDSATDWRRKAMWLDQFAAPAFSGMVFVSAFSDIGRHDWPSAIFLLAGALGYWSRMVYIFWKEQRCARP